MELKHISEISLETTRGQGERSRLAISILFIAAVVLYVVWNPSISGDVIVAVAAMVGAYMAMNIGANDVANNVGPAVGSKALPMIWALIIAAIFEAAGALIAGGDVVDTIRSGIIDPQAIPDANTFIWLMLASLLAGAIWLNLATAVGAPVSTTHSIVGAVVGAGMAASGMAAVDWIQLGNIALSWIVSPLLGGIVAAGFLYLIKHTITYKQNKAEAARTVVPWVIATMAWTFSTYLLLKGLSKIWKVGFVEASGIGLVVAVVVFLWLRARFKRADKSIANSKEGVNQLFTIPLICAAALLSFAHGSNDVANAIGPLAAIVDTARSGAMTGSASVPLWIMVVGGIGIALGLALYGPKLIRTVGSEITELDQMRAFCIAMAATVTVIVASQLGLPVSSTHIAVGGVFGVGFLREYLKTNYARMIEEIKRHHKKADRAEIDEFMKRFEKADIQEKGDMLRELKQRQKEKDEQMAPLSKNERKSLRSVYKHELVKRSQIYRIAAAWVITVPASALLSAMLFYMLRGMLLP